jgi:hypothetical protein
MSETHALPRRASSTLQQALSGEGLVVAQVAHVVAAGGSDGGWIGWLVSRPRELLGRYDSAEAAMTAAEAALEARRVEGTAAGNDGEIWPRVMTSAGPTWARSVRGGWRS